MERLTKRDENGTAIAPEFSDKTYIMQDDHDRFTGYINSPIVERLASLEDNLEKGIAFDLYGARGNGAYLAREDYQARPVVVIPLEDSEVKALLEIGIKNYLDRCCVVLDNEN